MRSDYHHTLAVTAADLDAYAANGASLWWTPGAPAPYWAAHPSWAEDRCLLTAEETQAALDLADPDDTATLCIATLNAEAPDAEARAVWGDARIAIVVILATGWSVAVGPRHAGRLAWRATLPDGRLRITPGLTAWLVEFPALRAATHWGDAVPLIAQEVV